MRALEGSCRHRAVVFFAYSPDPQPVMAAYSSIRRIGLRFCSSVRSIRGHRPAMLLPSALNAKASMSAKRAFSTSLNRALASSSSKADDIARYVDDKDGKTYNIPKPKRKALPILGEEDLKKIRADLYEKVGYEPDMKNRFETSDRLWKLW